jgi:hypothetical protein
MQFILILLHLLILGLFLLQSTEDTGSSLLFMYHDMAVLKRWDIALARKNVFQQAGLRIRFFFFTRHRGSY